MDDLKFDSRQEQQIFPLTNAPKSAIDRTKLRSHRVPAALSVGTGGLDVKHRNCFHLLQRLGVSGAILLRLYAFMADKGEI